MNLSKRALRHRGSINLLFRVPKQNSRFRKWLWKQIVFALLLLLIYLWLQRKKEMEIADKTILSDQIPEKEAIKTVESPPPPAPNDLTRIKGIGPKYATVLQRAGVLTFDHLARLDSNQIMSILTDAGVPFADPNTWPEQARFAAEGDWQGLAELQARI